MIRSKLSEFLDSFQQAYKEGIDTGMLDQNISMDKIYGDLTEVLVSLLQSIDR